MLQSITSSYDESLSTKVSIVIIFHAHNNRAHRFARPRRSLDTTNNRHRNHNIYLGNILRVVHRRSAKFNRTRHLIVRSSDDRTVANESLRSIVNVSFAVITAERFSLRPRNRVSLRARLFAALQYNAS